MSTATDETPKQAEPKAEPKAKSSTVYVILGMLGVDAPGIEFENVWTVLGDQAAPSRAGALTAFFSSPKSEPRFDVSYQAVPESSWKAMRLKARPPVAVTEAE